MSGLYRCLPAALLMTFSATTAVAAEKSEVICKSGDLVRRVIIEVGDLNTSLPCEVVYWKDKEAPGVRRVLWNARSDAAFCDSQAAGLVDKLSSAGWNCDGGGATVQANAAPAPAPAQPAPAAPAPQTTTVPAVDAATAPAAPAVVQPAPAAPATPTTTAALETTPAPAAPAAGTPTTTDAEDLQTAAIAPAATPTGVLNEQLQTVIDANLTSLNQSVDGDFQAQIGDFGDLNSDGIDDAVVFFNYESSTADFTQFVAAYLFNGENYHLAATKPVGGTDLAVRQVEVESIVGGSIQLRLLLNDASQTENRSAAMVLRDGQLVEIQ